MPNAPLTQLTPLLVTLVIGAGALHATWNAIAAGVADRLLAFALMGVAWTAGGVVMLAAAGMPAAGAVWYAVISAVIHIGYDLALMNSYRVGAFSQTYPIARGTSPLVVAVGAYVLAGERLGAAALAGVVILAGGLMSLALSSGRLARRDLPAVGAALLTGLTIASYTMVDGIGVRHAHNALGYGGLLFALQGPVFPVVAALRRRVGRDREGQTAAGRLAGVGRETVSRGLLAGVLSLVAYGAVLWAQTRAPLAEVAAIRETSVVFAALIGVIFLREGFGGRRVIAAVLIAAGIVLMAT
jgi:drug/metabolite transporter (DMT)-like permease